MTVLFQHHFTLHNCIQSMFQEEEFGGKCWYVEIVLSMYRDVNYCRHCLVCGQKANMKRKLSISRAPTILMIHLKRFQFDM